MNNWTKQTTILVAAAMLSAAAFAQDAKVKTQKTDTQEEIVIRKKGDNIEKTTIVIDGDKVTINGKPMDDYKGDNLTVTKRRSTGSITRAYGANPRVAINGAGVSGYGAYAPAAVGNKAVLGVTTEKADGGVKITSLTDESGADKAGLKADDVITKVGDKKIETPGDLVDAIGKYKPNDKVDVAYNRGGKASKVTATLGENKFKAFSFNMNDQNFNFDMPARPMPPSLNGNLFAWNRKPKIGMQIQDVEEGKGVKVNEVDDDTPAAKAGFKEGDVITSVNGKEIEGVDELRKEIAELKEGGSVKVDFKRDGKVQTAEIKIQKKLKTADL